MHRRFLHYTRLTAPLAGVVIAAGLLGSCAPKGARSELPLRPGLPPADTVYAGEELELLLTDLTGGWYYDSAGKSTDRGEYGYNRWNRRFLAGWELYDAGGARLDSLTGVCITTPWSAERHYDNGVIEKVECPPNLPGLLVTIRLPRRMAFNFRPLFDFRSLDHEESPTYRDSVRKSPAAELMVSRRDGTGGWLALVSDRKAALVPALGEVWVVHPVGELIGRTAVSRCHVPWEMQIGKTRRAAFAIGWGGDAAQAAANTRSILDSRDEWRKARRKWALDILEPLRLQTEDPAFEHAFARAELTLAGLLARRNRELFLASGIPYRASAEGWQTMAAIPGLTRLGGGTAAARELILPFLRRQNSDSASTRFGMLPSVIGADSARYRVPLLAGLAAATWRRLSPWRVESDTTFEDSLARCVAVDLLATIHRRVRDGLAVSDSGEHFLYDSPLAPPRPGATIESQFLLHDERAFVARHPRMEAVAPGLLPSLVKYRERGLQVTAMRGPQELIERLADREKSRRYVAGMSDAYDLPFDLGTALMFFSFNHRAPADRLPFKGGGDTLTVDLFTQDTTVRAVWLISYGVTAAGASSNEPRLLRTALAMQMAGATGLRSLSPLDPAFQQRHRYRLDEAPEGTTMEGDVLVWTAGRLGDLYAAAGMRDSLLSLTSNLTEILMRQGVAGALPEAEEPFAGVAGVPVGSPVFATSLAEYIRLVYDRLLGIRLSEGRLVKFTPRPPDGWGGFRVRFNAYGGTVSIERLAPDHWLVGQEGIEPSLVVALDVIPAPGGRGRHSVRIEPGERREVRFHPYENDNWKGETLGL